MANEIITEEEFIELFAANDGSLKKMAKATGMDIRGLYRRRRRLESKRGVSLAPRSTGAETPSSARKEDRQHIEIENGCVMVFSDAHFWPGVSCPAHTSLVSFIKQLKPVAIINNGDSLDGAKISRHARIGWDSTPSVIQELQANLDRLGAISSAAGPGCKLVWNLGNHDARFETRLAAVAQEYEHVKGMKLKDHFPEWLPSWSTWVNEDVVVKHRFKGGLYAAANNAIWSGKTIVTSHDHMLWCKPFSDYNGTRWGIDTGCLADTNGPQFLDYTEDNPVNWQSGFVILWFQDGEFSGPELVYVDQEGRTYYRGVISQAQT